MKSNWTAALPPSRSTGEAPAGGVAGDMNLVRAALTEVRANVPNVADDLADGAAKVAMTTAERTKLSGVATNATANAADAALRDRSTHTGTQPISATTGLQTALDGKVVAVTAGLKLWKGTQGEYDAIGTKDANTLYVITT